MFHNYGLRIEQAKYAQNNYAIFEQTAIDDFIKRVDPKEIEKAIRSFADSSQPERKDGGVVMLAGKKVKISFVADPKEAGAYIAQFNYVDNPKAPEDLAELVKIAIRGAGTDEDQVYAVAAAYRQYCQDIGKNEVTEMQRVFAAYKKTYGVSMDKDIQDDFGDTFNHDEFQNFMMRGLFLMGNPSDVGEQKAKRIANFSQPDFAVRMLMVDKDHTNSIEFLLSCPLKYLRVINDALKQQNGGKGIVETLSDSKFSSDVKDMVKTYLMGAGLVKKSNEFNHAVKISAEGRANIEPAYSFDPSSVAL